MTRPVAGRYVPFIRSVGRPLASSARPVAAEYPHPPNLEGLYPYQVEGVRWLRERRKGLLADEMGLGKTVQVLRALQRRPRAIVVCPAFLRCVWRDTAARFRPDLSVYLCRPGEFELPSDSIGHVSVVSYESLPEAPKNCFHRRLLPAANLSATTLVVDEAHYCKNTRTDRALKVRLLAQQCGRVWGCTGSPLPDHPFDLWGTLSSLGLAREAFGSWDEFLKAFNASRNQWGGYEFNVPERDIRELLRRVSLRRLKSDVMPDLPPKVRQEMAVDCPIELAVTLDGILTEWQDRDELPPFEALSAVRSAIARSRVGALLEHVERYEEEKVPLVVFSMHREPVLSLAGRPGWGIITGETPPPQREMLVNMFQEGLLVGLAGTIQAMGVGLTLTRASHCLFVDLSWTPGENVQAEDRLHRIGQGAQSVTIVRMVADHPVDRRVLEILDKKAELIARVVG